jgi:hypothetical protein
MNSPDRDIAVRNEFFEQTNAHANNRRCLSLIE